MIQIIKKFMDDLNEEFPCIKVIDNVPTKVDDICFRCGKYFSFYLVIFSTLNTFTEILEKDTEYG